MKRFEEVAVEGTQIIGITAAWIINAATWIVHGTTGTCLRAEHTALGISVSLIYNGVIIIVTGCIIRLQPVFLPFCVQFQMEGV